MKNLTFLSSQLGFAPYLTTRQSRSDSLSLVSRLSDLPTHVGRIVTMLLLLLTIGVGQMWGTDHTSTFTTSDALTDNTITKNSAVWNVGTIVGAGSPTVTFVSQKWNGTTKQAIKVGWKKDNYYSTITFSTDYFTNWDVSKVAITFALNGGVSTTLTATQGGTTIGSTTYSTSQTWNTQTLQTSTGHGGRLIITIETTQAILINEIKVTYTNTPHTITFNAGSGTCGTASSGSVTNYTLPTATPPASCASEGWGFYGWATASQATETETAPAIVGKAGDNYRPGANVTLYAVYAKGEYTKETSAITSGSKYLIVGATGGNNYIMKSEPMEIYDGVGGIFGMNAIKVNESSSGKYTAAAVNANWCYTIEGTAGNYYIRDVVNSSSYNYADMAYSKFWGRSADADDKYTITVSSGIWTIRNNYYDDGYNYLGFDNTDLAFFIYGSAQNIYLYKETSTPKYHSSPSCAASCDAPTSPVKGSVNASSQRVEWTDAGNAGDGYLIAYSTTEHTNAPASSVKSTGTSGSYTVISSANKYADIPCNTAGTYDWWVRSVCDASGDSYSDWVKGTAFTMKQIYLQVNDNWAGDNANFAAYYWNADPKTGFTKIMTEQTDCEDKIYTCVFPTDYSNMKFVRLDPIQIDPVVNFDNRWNETGNLTLAADKNYYQITGGTGSSVTGSWTTYAQKVKVSFNKNTTADGVTNPSYQCVVVTSGRATAPTIGDMSHDRLGYQLSGWKDGGTTWNFSTMGFAADKTLDAYWTAGATTKIALKPTWSDQDWRSGSCIVYAHCYIDGTNQFEDILMTGNVCDAYLVADAPYGTTHISFARCKAGTSLPLGEWGTNDNVYNYVAGQEIGGTNTYEITGWGSGKVGTATKAGSAYVAPTYTISFNQGTGTGGSTESHTGIACNGSQTIRANGFNKTGYHFTGWTSNVSVTVGGASTTSVGAGATITNITQNITLTAQWAANTYTVTYDKNGGGDGTGTADQSFTYDVAQNLRACGFTAPGTHKYFAGWDESSSAANPTYTAGQSVSNLTNTDGETVTLYAIWKDHTFTNYRTLCCTDWDAPSLTGYSTSLTAGGSTTTISTGGATTYGTQTCESSNTDVLTVTDAGVITPVGAGTATVTMTWAGNATYCEKSATTNTITVSGNLNVTFKKNGGTGTDDQTQSIPYNTATNLKTLSTLGITAPSCKEFYGWADSQSKADAGTRDYEDGEEVTILAGMTLYAVWKDITYAVSDGTMTGVGSHSYSSNPITCGTTLTITCAADGTHKGNPTVTASGTHGTITVVSATSVTIANVTSAITVNISYTAKDNYTVTLNPGSGSLSATGSWSKSGDNLTQTVMEGTSVTALPSATPGCAGWSFVGWATSEADNAGSDPTSYAAGATPEPTGNVTYYAVYRKNAAGGTTYNKITSTGDLTTGNYVIKTSSQAMKNVCNWSEYSSYYYMSETSNSATGASLTNDNADITWTIIKFDTKYAIKNGTNFIGIGSDGLLTYNTDPHLFTAAYDGTSNGWVFTSDTYTSYQLIYSTWFRSGTAQSTAITLYKQGSGLTGNYYTSPSCGDITVSGVADPVAGGTVTLSATSAKQGDIVYAFYTADPAYKFDEWSISGTSAALSSTTSHMTEITVGSTTTTVTANFDERVFYTVTWKANNAALTSNAELGGAPGSEDRASTSVETGEKVTKLPPVPTSCETGSGKSDIFVGWSTKDWNGYKNAKGDLPDGTVIFASAEDAPTVTANVTYYAVWAQVEATSRNYTLDFAISATAASATAITIDKLKTGLVNSATNNTYWDVDNIVLTGTVYQDSGDDKKIGARLGANGGTGSIAMPLLPAGQVAVTSLVANVKGYGDDETNFDLTAYFSDGTNDKQTLPDAPSYVTTSAADYTAEYSNYKTLKKIVIATNTNKKRIYVCSIKVNYKNYIKYLTKCCDNEITIGTPTKTAGLGTVTFASGGEAIAVSGTVETCAGVTTITATVTPNLGYQCTALTFSRADGEDLTPDPAISVPFTAATAFDLEFEQNANTTLNTTMTFAVLYDHYIDNMHYNSTIDKSGNYGTAPTLSSETKGSECTGLHYKFIGWIPESDMNMTTGVPKTTDNMVAGGATGKYATGTNYYAIWAEEE